jgi:hypothetical protein
MTRHGQVERLISLLKGAYLARDRAEIGTAWSERLMARVREIGPLTVEARFLPLFEQFVWRLAPAVCVLAIVLAVLLMAVRLTNGPGDPFQPIVSDMEDSVLTQLFGA